MNYETDYLKLSYFGIFNEDGELVERPEVSKYCFGLEDSDYHFDVNLYNDKHHFIRFKGFVVDDEIGPLTLLCNEELNVTLKVLNRRTCPEFIDVVTVADLFKKYPQINI